MPQFIVVPAADVTGEEVTTIANALLRSTTALTGLTNGASYRAITVDFSPTFRPADFIVTNQADFDALTAAQVTGKHVMIMDGAAVAWGRGNFQNQNLGGAVFFGEGVAKLKTSRASRQFSKIEIDRVHNCTLENLFISPTTKTVAVTVFSNEDLTIQRNYILGSEPDPQGDYSGGFSTFPGEDGIRSINAAPKRMRIYDNFIYGVAYGIRTNVDDWIEIVGNHIDMYYQDGVQINHLAATDNAATLFSFNMMTRPLSLGEDVGNPHGDGLQMVGGSSTRTAMIEGSGCDRGNARGRGQPFFVSNPVATDGVHAVMRAMATRDDAFFNYSFLSSKRVRMDRVAQLPLLGAAYPSNKGGVRISGIDADALLDMRNTVAPVISTVIGTRTDTNVLDTPSIPDRASALARYPEAAQYDSEVRLSLAQLFDAATPAGDAVGRSPQEVVVTAPDIMDFSLSVAFAPVPSLTPGTLTPTATGFSVAVETTVDGNPLFWAVAPTGTAVPTARDIKLRRITSAVVYGWVPVHVNETTRTITGTGLVTATDYVLFVMQENGWSRLSAVSSVEFTTD